MYSAVPVVLDHVRVHRHSTAYRRGLGPNWLFQSRSHLCCKALRRRWIHEESCKQLYVLLVLWPYQRQQSSESPFCLQSLFVFADHCSSRSTASAAGESDLVRKLFIAKATAVSTRLTAYMAIKSRRHLNCSPSRIVGLAIATAFVNTYRLISG